MSNAIQCKAPLYATATLYVWYFIKKLSDYDLSLVCTSKCDDKYLNCVTACSDSDCLMECNRESISCTEGKHLKIN